MSNLPVVVKKQSLHPFTLECNFQNLPVCIINGIRRTILSEIPIFVFNGLPYEKNDIHIHKNTSRLNNEILKQRISCIPIHLTDFTIPYDQVEFYIHVENTTPNMLFVTTDDFQIRQIQPDESVEKIPPNPELLSKLNPKLLFPLDPITKSPIVITRLKPKLNDDIPGEQLQFSAKISISSANENGCFNVASTCSFSNTMDETAANIAWEKSVTNTTFETPEEESSHRENWMLLDGKRHFKEKHFDFILETIGIYDNEILIKTACKIMVEHLNHIQQLEHLTIQDSHSTMENGKDIILSIDFSIGKMLEYVLYNDYKEQSKNISYVSFFKKHPHDDDSILRIVLKPDTDVSIETMLTSSATKLIDLLDSISKLF